MSKNPIPPTPTRKDYTEDEVYRIQAEQNAKPIFDREDPFPLFQEWMSDARHLEPNDSNAMSLATVDEAGMPDVRIVLLKTFDQNGFVFFTNGESEKGRQLSATPKAALCFHWKSLRRQVRVRGQVEAVSVQESDDYFSSRARGSQIGAVASDQSRPLESREVFEQRIEAVTQKFEGREIPRPPHWGGWRIKPDVIEFWRDRPFRLHDRMVFTATANGWAKSRLFP